MISAFSIYYINLTKKGGMASFEDLTYEQLWKLVEDFVNTLDIPKKFQFGTIVNFFKQKYPEESMDGFNALAGLLTYLLKMGLGLSRENPRRLYDIPPIVVMFVVEVLNRMTNGEIDLEVEFENNQFYITQKNISPLIGVINNEQSPDDLQNVLLKAFRSPETFSLEKKLRALRRNREEAPAVEVPAVEAPTVEAPAPVAEPVKVPVQEESRSQSIEDLFDRIRELEGTKDRLNGSLDRIEFLVEQGLKEPDNMHKVMGTLYAIKAMCS